MPVGGVNDKKRLRLSWKVDECKPLVGGIRPHMYCLPILKRESHRVGRCRLTLSNPR